MKSAFWRRCGRLWCQGLLLCALRCAQLKTGFDPDTGLTVPNVPGPLLLGLLAFCAVVYLVLCLRLPKGETSRFAAPGQGAAVAAVIGSLLLAAGGVLFLLEAIPAQNPSGILAGVLAMFSGGGTILLVRQLRREDAPHVMPILPAMFMGVFLVLDVYLHNASDPVLARFYIPLLAAALVAYSFSQLAGLLRGEQINRSFVFIADMAVLVCLTALADGVPARMLLCGGTAVVLTVFLLLREPVPAPVEAELSSRD